MPKSEEHLSPHFTDKELACRCVRTTPRMATSKKQAEIRLRPLETLREEIRLQQKNHKRLPARAKRECEAFSALLRPERSPGISRASGRAETLKAGEPFPPPCAFAVISA